MFWKRKQPDPVRQRPAEEFRRRVEDYQPEPVTNSQLGCVGCKYATEDLMTCKKYSGQKPGCVFYGQPCQEFKA